MLSPSKEIRTMVCVLIICLFAFSSSLFAQNTSGSITGAVQDASGAVIPGAQVKLVNQDQGVTTQQTITNEAGLYVFSALPASNYTVTVELPGFKTYTKKDIKLFVNDKMGLPPIVLEVGAQGESVTVEAQSVALETVSAERSGVVTGRQILDIALNGRDFTRLLKTVPGAPADAVSGSTTFNGQRANQNNFTVDGQTVTDSGVNQQFAYRISMDAIAEFKVSTTSQTAEFGRNSGAQVQVASKSGGADFHGGGYWFKRHEGWNANSFTNNRSGTPRQIYRFMTAGYDVGGPIKKDKLFFFVSNEWGRSKTPPAPRRITVPTALERTGDFSKTVDGAGIPVVIKDPLTGQPFQGNIIPPNRITPLGAQVLKWLPLPNVTGQLTYNYESQVASELPSFDQLYRVDYNINSKNRAYVRVIDSKQTQNNPYGRADSANNLALNALSAPTYGWSVSVNLATILSPTLTNELQVGKAKNGIPGDAPPANSIYYRKNAGITIPLLYPNADPSGLVPNFGFGGVPVPPGTSTQVTSFAGLPYYNANPITNVTDNISKVLGTHTLKFGGFVEYAIKHESAFRPYNGTILFDRDSANPGDTNWAFSNALLGNYQQYQQWSKLLIEDAPYWNYEFFAQDSWKASRKLTLNYGMRMNFVPALYEKNNLFTNFDDSAYDPNKKVVLYQPTTVGGVRLAKNPITGATGPAVLIGAIVPGIGDPANGIVHAGKNGTPRGLIDNRGVQWGPRLGVAYQMNNKSVFRAGGGVFFERIATSAVGYTSNFLTNPPDVQLSQIYYGNLADIGSSAGALFPVQITQLAKDGHVPTTYNFNMGIQQELPGKVLLDVSYVGTQSRHLIEFAPFNALAFGSAWLPQNQDPTKPTNLDGSNALPPNLYRPYLGYAGGRVSSGQSAQAKYDFGGSANYNALQVSVNRRAGRGLQFGGNYTWSRALGTTDAHLTNTRAVNYGLLALDRSHGLTFNYVYDIPSLAKMASFLDNPVGRQIFGGWELSGLSSFSVGAPQTASYSLTTASGAALNRLITGSEDFAPRVVLTCDPNKNRGDRTILAYIDTSCFAPAPKGSIGNDSGINTIRGPGLNNWDMSMFKKIQYSENPSRYIQLRVEAYNVFNHTNWTTLNTVAQFNPTTGALVNAASATNPNNFGALTAVRATGQPGSPRIIQLAGKLYF
jgi:Carboxypeptidase regulatory-like domain/TonB-dependent Receptor Plug Domain